MGKSGIWSTYIVRIWYYQVYQLFYHLCALLIINPFVIHSIAYLKSFVFVLAKTFDKFCNRRNATT